VIRKLLKVQPTDARPLSFGSQLEQRLREIPRRPYVFECCDGPDPPVDARRETTEENRRSVVWNDQKRAIEVRHVIREESCLVRSPQLGIHDQCRQLMLCQHMSDSSYAPLENFRRNF